MLSSSPDVNTPDQVNKPHLILFFDINGTILVSDSAKGKDAETAIAQILAEEFKAVWDASVTTTPMSYRHYIRDHLINSKPPGEEKSFSDYYRDFMPFLRRIQHPLLAEIETTYNQMREKLKDGDIFPSVINMINRLKEDNWNFTIVLRSFGDDAPHAMEEISRRAKIQFLPEASFKQGVLETADQQRLLTPGQWLACIQPGAHTSWHDDYLYWKDNDFKRAFGKPFPIASFPSNKLSIVFDDNAKDKEIIAPKRVGTFEILDQDDYYTSLCDSGRIVAVNTMRAILDDDYYFGLIVRATLKMHLPKLSMLVGARDRSSIGTDDEKLTPDLSRAQTARF